MSKEHEAFIKKVESRELKIKITRVVILIGFIFIWELCARLKVIDPFLTSSPSRVIKSLISIIKTGSLLDHILTTCYETIIGFTFGTIIGTLIAIVLWAMPFVSKVLDPYLVVLNALPKVALAPIIIFWAGNGITAIIVIALLISVVTTILTVLTGFNEVDKGKIKLMRTLRASKIQILKYLVFPSNIRVLISALKINVGLSWVGVIMGEFLVARKGLGFLIVYGGQVSQLDMVMMSIIILSLIAFLMYKGVSVLEEKISR